MNKNLSDNQKFVRKKQFDEITVTEGFKTIDEEDQRTMSAKRSLSPRGRMLARC